MEQEIRDRYRLKQRAILEEINQHRWERIDISQVFRDITADMHREIREMKEREERGINKKTSLRRLTGDISHHRRIQLPNLNTPEKKPSPRHLQYQIKQIERQHRDLPWTEMSPNWLNMTNKPLPPVPSEMSLTEETLYDGLACEAKKVTYPVKAQREKISVVTLGQKAASRRI